MKRLEFLPEVEDEILDAIAIHLGANRGSQMCEWL